MKNYSQKLGQGVCVEFVTNSRHIVAEACFFCKDAKMTGGFFPSFSLERMHDFLRCKNYVGSCTTYQHCFALIKRRRLPNCQALQFHTKHNFGCHLGIAYSVGCQCRPNNTNVVKIFVFGTRISCIHENCNLISCSIRRIRK